MPPMFRRVVLALIVAVGLAAIAAWVIGRQHYSNLILKSCFNDVAGLKAGATVRIAGVDVGNVRRVRANPSIRNCPAEVEMGLVTPYEFTVPNDAIAAISTAGVLGEAYVEIDTSRAVGSPAANYAYLPGKQGKQVDILEVLTGLIESAKAKQAENRDSGKKTPSLK